MLSRRLPSNRFFTATVEMDDSIREGVEALGTGLGGALLSWFGMKLHLDRRDKRRDDERSDRAEERRLEALGDSNKLLFDELKRQIAELREECEECHRGKAEQWSHILAQQTWLIKIEAAMKAKGIQIEFPPLISPKMAMDGNMRMASGGGE